MTATILPADVEVTPHENPGTFLVCPIWAGVDRPNVGGIVVRGKKNADRLRRAYLDGAAYHRAAIATDVNGKTYVAAASLVMGRCLNADLKRIGY